MGAQIVEINDENVETDDVEVLMQRLDKGGLPMVVTFRLNPVCLLFFNSKTEKLFLYSG